MKHDEFSGEELRERRVALGFTQMDVFEHAHIPVEYVDALEKGNFRALPAPCYALGFLKTYCRFIGFEPEPFLAAYSESVRPPQRTFFRRPTVSLPAMTFSRRMSNMLTWAAVCAVIALCWFTYTVVVQPQSDGAEGRAEAVTRDLVVPPPVSELE